MLIQIRERREYKEGEQDRFLIPIRNWSWRVRQSMEGGTKENTPIICNERNAESSRSRQKKCSLRNQRKEILKLTLSPIPCQYELCFR